MKPFFFFFVLPLLLGSAWSKRAPPVPTDCTTEPFDEEDGGGDDFGGGLHLTCSLSAINSEREQTNFSVVPSSHTLGLTVRCRDPSPGRLEPGGFASLVHLRKLSLDGCHLSELPDRAFWGLDKLTSLKIRTNSAGVLRVTSGAFIGLSKLEHLDLSGNYVRSLQPGALCSPPSHGPHRLRSLNLGKNELSSLEDVGGVACLGETLTSLDLSFNRMEMVGASAGLKRLSNLEELRLNNNAARNLKGDLLRAKPRLRFVDLSNNNLASLPGELFLGAPGLRRVSLANNSLSFLPQGLLRSLSRSLEVLDLSGNLLTSLEGIAGLSKLTSLDVSHNRIVSIDSAALFRGLDSLRSLKMNNNKISRLPALPLPALTSLVLSHNSLSGRLSPSRLLSRTSSLSHLLLDNNHIESLPRQVFSNTSSLTVLDLSHNSLRGSIPEPVMGLKKLQSFAISHNYLEDLSGLRLPALWRLQVAGNKLSNLTTSQLEGLPALQVLDLSQNSIGSIEKGAFNGNKPLQALRLDDNRLSKMEGLFHALPNLSWLNVSANQISVFDLAMVPKTLKWLDLHQNQLSALENYFGVEKDSQIAHLDASFNLIREVGPQNVPDAVETLLLNDNRVDSLVPYTFFKKDRLKKVDLSVNRLESIDRNALRLSSDDSTISPSQPKFFLGGNPIRCDCDMAWFKTVNNVDVGNLQNFPFVADLESIYCQLLYTRQKAYIPLVEAKTEDFLCSYKTHCFALCHCCDYDACDCEMTCPSNCTCYHDTTWSKNIAECSSAEFQDLPDQLPMDATEIFLDGNDIGDLHSHTFIGRKNLRVLYLNNSKIMSVENHTFNGLSVLVELHLEGNSIDKLQGDEFHGLTMLRELHLQDNRIVTVNNNTFRNLKSLQVLNLSGNQIRDFPAWQLSFNTLLTKVHLAGNPWSCECRFVSSYKQWLGKFRAKVMDAGSVVCLRDDRTSNKAISILHGNFEEVLSCLPPPPPPSKEEVSTRIQRKDLSLKSQDGMVTSAEESGDIFGDFLPIFLGVMAAFILVLVLLIAAFAYRDEARLWLYSKYGVRFFHRVDGSGTGNCIADSDKIFDAFVAYSAKDDAFVRQMLAQELELPPIPPPPPPPMNGRASDYHLSQHSYASHTLQQHLTGQYKLCLLYRDLPVQQAPYAVADTVVQAADASKRTILVLSDHFLKSEWSRFDFKSGLHQALNSCCGSGGGKRRSPKKLVVVLLGDVASRRDLDPDLRLYLKSAVVVQWGDRLFWEKLRYALPDVRRPHHHTLNGVTPGKRQLSQLSQLSQLTEAFSPDNSFRYETYHRANGGANPRQMSTQPRSVRSGGGSSSGGGTYQSVGTPDEQDSTRTMTIHI